jgi:tetratricopeptide (TPR) repeat protein
MVMPEQENQDPERARAFFKKAAALAGTENFDYAIDMYLQGLHYAPEALEEGHLLLCEMGIQRQGLGGKKPSLAEKVKCLRGRTPLEQMLNAEYLFVKDPDHLPYAESMLKAAVAGGYNKVADWIANLVFQRNNAAPKPSLHTYLLLKDSYITLGKLDKATAALQQAVRLKPEDKELSDEFKNISAELTMVRGNYEGEGDFRKSIKDRELQEKLYAQERVIKTEDYRAGAIERAREKVTQKPDLAANVFELADALSDMEDEQSENEAVALLENTFKRTSDFSFQQKAGQIRIKQLRRKIRQAQTSLENAPDNTQTKQLLDQLTTEFNRTELEHYHLCMINYPTDLRSKYEYALRLVRFERFDEAIPLFQDAQKEPRYKIASMNQIGYCFLRKGWLDDAIDIYTQAIDSHEIKDDAISKDLRYNLASAYQEKGQAQKALDIFRKIAQEDFAYKDVSQRVDKLRVQKTEPASQ